jgi:lipopolysaccharide/colanic/teichoic acid biosynthesis glycosyltransferase
MFKFRSMRADLADAHASKLTQIGDSRVTKVGQFLRSTSLDELPQLLNVWLGHMSIVGPRPHAAGALAGEALYWEVDQRYWDRHAVMPGMTGLAQIRGHRGTTFEHVD